MFNKWPRVFLNADAVGDDQFVEVPRKQLFERSAREVSISERQPDIARDAAMRICNTSKFPQSIEHGLARRNRVILDEVGRYNRA